MADREKLAEIVERAAHRCLPSNTERFHLNMFVRDLISNGVVVREKDVIMNPVRKYRTHYSDDYCPVCGKQQKTAKRSMEKPWYCERCGQKLGWDGFNQFPEPPADMRKGENDG